MTKTKACNALKRLIDTNRIELEVEEWVERDEKKEELGEQ